MKARISGKTGRKFTIDIKIIFFDIYFAYYKPCYANVAVQYSSEWNLKAKLMLPYNKLLYAEDGSNGWSVHGIPGDSSGLELCVFINSEGKGTLKIFTDVPDYLRVNVKSAKVTGYYKDYINADSINLLARTTDIDYRNGIGIADPRKIILNKTSADNLGIKVGSVLTFCNSGKCKVIRLENSGNNKYICTVDKPLTNLDSYSYVRVDHDEPAAKDILKVRSKK